MTAPTACMHPDWEWTGGDHVCIDCRRVVPIDHRRVVPPLAAGSTSPVGACSSLHPTNPFATRCTRPSGHGFDHSAPMSNGSVCQWPNDDSAYDKQHAPAPGRKDDAGKPDYTLLPWDALELVVRVLAHGADKYGRENYLGVADGYERYRAAAFRHLVAVVRGEWADPESDLPHLAHMVASGLIALVLGGKQQGGKGT